MAKEAAQAIHRLMEETRGYSGNAKDGGDVDDLLDEGEDFLVQKKWYEAIRKFVAARKIEPGNSSALLGLHRAVKGFDVDQKIQQPRGRKLSEPEIKDYIISQGRALGLINQYTQFMAYAPQRNLSQNATLGYVLRGADKPDILYISDRFIEKLGELNEIITKRDNKGLNELVKMIIEISLLHEQGHVRFKTVDNEALAQKNVRDTAGSWNPRVTPKRR